MQLDEWRKSRSTVTTLPSGLDAELRRVSVLDLVGQGKIPNTLFGMIANLDAGNVAITPELISELTPLLNELAKVTMVNPPVADAGDVDHLGLDEMEFMDKLYIFQWANSAVKQVAPFLSRSDGSMEPAPGEQNVPEPA